MLVHNTKLSILGSLCIVARNTFVLYIFFLCIHWTSSLFTGWQPGIQEGSADWDEEWDKLEEEGILAVSI